LFLATEACFLNDADNYSTLCTVNVDLSQMGKALGPFKGAGGRIFYKADFDIVLLFGLTELKAQLVWKENVRLLLICCSPLGSLDKMLTKSVACLQGVEKRSPAKIVYEPMTTNFSTKQ